MRSFVLSAGLAAVVAFSSSCVYFPLSRAYLGWSTQICGRKTVGTRLCSGVIAVFLLPGWALSLVADLPLSVLELIFGYAPFHDPVVKVDPRAIVENEPQVLPDNQPGETWELTKLTADLPQFHFKKLQDGEIIEEFMLTVTEDGEFKLHLDDQAKLAKAIPSKYFQGHTKASASLDSLEKIP